MTAINGELSPYERDERKKLLGRAIRKTCPKKRKYVIACLLFDARSKTRVEIGHQLGTARLATVTSWVKKGRDLIRAELPYAKDIPY